MAFFQVEKQNNFVIADEFQSGRVKCREKGEIANGGFRATMVSWAVKSVQGDPVLDAALGRLRT